MSKTKEKIKVLCAISGGVDSAVAATLLVKQGYEVTGGFIKCFTDPITGSSCWLNEKRDATRVCAKLGIKLRVFDFEKEYRQSVVDYIYREYQAGRTPNPDVMCNKHVKFPLLIREAKKLGFDYIVTGHYARVSLLSFPRRRESSVRLLQAKDDNKDQTYFLHQLKQKELRQVLFPIGDYTKPQVRELAKKFGLPVAQKEESMGICFIGEVPLRQFLSKKIKPRPGKIILPNGTVVGEHSGLPFYTIGQRIAASHRCHSDPPMRRRRIPCRQKRSFAGVQDDNQKPVYVVAKNKRKNQIIVANENSSLLYKKEVVVQKVNWIAGQPPKLPLTCLVRLRHRQPLQKAIIRRSISNIKYKISFSRPQRAAAPGQFAVFYKGDICLGGGEIK